MQEKLILRHKIEFSCDCTRFENQKHKTKSFVQICYDFERYKHANISEYL